MVIQCYLSRLTPTPLPFRRYVSRINLDQYPPERIRNFAIIAHIDHGKSSLSDRLLEITGSIKHGGSQVLDTLKVERERGITVKAQGAAMIYGNTLLNLVDTPGHVDFATEVSRSLLACQGALLLVDATQGIQAQTLSVLEAAKNIKSIIGIVNKIDLPNAEPERVREQVAKLLVGRSNAPILSVSAKTGQGCKDVLEAIVKHIPAPDSSGSRPLRALIFDTHFDDYRGVVLLVSIVDGSIKKGDKISLLSLGQRTFEVSDVGILTPAPMSIPSSLNAGQVGYITCGMKNETDGNVGDTIFRPGQPVKGIAEFKPLQNVVFAGIYPQDPSDFPKLDESIQRLMLTDRAVTLARESSTALGQGFRLGFLGSLHLDIFRQRLEDEYAAEVIITKPFVPLKLLFKDGTAKEIRSVEEFPNHADVKVQQRISEFQEPVVKVTLILPEEYLGETLALCSEHRGKYLSMDYFDAQENPRIKLEYEMPLAAIVTTFHSRLKSATSGFASLDYYAAGFVQSDLVKLLILLNGKPVDALCSVCHRSEAESDGKETLARLKKVISRQNFEVVLQAAIGSKVLARERIAPFRKDVTAGLYGGHFERKMKHLVKQKESKKRAKRFGNVELPFEAFSAVLSVPRAKSK